MSYTYPKKIFKSNIRDFSIGNLHIPSSNSLPFLKTEGGSSNPILAIEILMHTPKNYSPVLKKYWGNVINDMILWAQKAEQLNCDALALKFNIETIDEVQNAVTLLKEILKTTTKTLIITGSNKKNLDLILLPELSKIINRQSIIGIAEQETYKVLIDSIIEKELAVIARTPIDINLAKELNILLTDNKVSPDKILIDTNVASLGYGLDYGYSIIERVKLAGLEGDEMLNFPIIAFVGEEAWKAKESRVNDFDTNFGNLHDRALAWESATATSIMLAGANILVLWHPEILVQLKKFIGES